MDIKKVGRKKILLGYMCAFLSLVGAVVPFVQGWFFFLLTLVLLKDKYVSIRWLFYWMQAKWPAFKKLYIKVMPRIDEKLKKWGVE